MSVLPTMLERLAHRGPDGRGTWTSDWQDWRIELGHRRLAIIDIAGGAQPMGNEDGSLQITFNGEIYNAPALRCALEAQDHRFRTHSDTESIVHLFEQHGAAGIEQLNGMFALAIWDQRSGTLTLARDRAGIKPLYYAMLGDGAMIFASELRALLEHPAVKRRIDPAGLSSYFFRDYIPPPRTAIAGVRKLEPGHWLAWKDGTIDGPHPFWRPDFHPRPLELIPAIEQAVHDYLLSDVPVGVFLSGGIDSSLVAALAMRQAGQRLATFSLGFDDPDFDESSFARRVAQRIGSEHFEQRIGESELLAHLDEALDALDEPLADASILPTYLLSGVASRHVKVVLGGDGGDELWGGYPTYPAHRLARFFAMMPSPLRRGVLAPLVRALPARHSYQSLEWKLKRFVLRWDDQLLRRHQRWMSSTDLPELRDALAHRDEPVFFDPPFRLPDVERDPLNAILFYDFATYLSGSVLTKVDRASMAHGLEVRPPLLDNRLIDLAFSVPSSLKVRPTMRGTRTKWLLKRACAEAGVLPDEIIARPKRGFAIPLGRWITGPLRPRLQVVLDRSPLWDTGLLERETFRRWYDQHQRRRVDYSKPLWALLVLDHWYRRVF